MANEITITTGLTVRKGNLNHRPPRRTFKADMAGSTGISPGAILVTTDGVDLEFTELADPGWCHITNIAEDGGSDIQYGPYDPETDRYYGWFNISPGESSVFKFDQQFQWESYPASEQGTGTGGQTNRLRFRAKTAACYVLVEAIER